MHARKNHYRYRYTEISFHLLITTKSGKLALIMSHAQFILTEVPLWAHACYSSSYSLLKEEKKFEIIGGENVEELIKSPCTHEVHIVDKHVYF